MPFEVALNQHSLALAKESLRVSLLDAVDLYEKYTFDGDNSESLAQAIAALNELRGACTILEMPGAQLLTEELVAYLKAIAESELEPKEWVLSAASRALVALQQYLELIAQEGIDIPPLAADPVNELRRGRSQALLPESQLYAETIPQFTGVSTLESKSEPLVGEELKSTAASLRHMYQLGLLAILKNDRPLVHFELMQRAAKRMTGIIVPGEWQRFWILAEIVLSCFANGGLGISRTRKQLFMQLEQNFKWFTKGEAALAKPVPALLEHELLFLLMLSSYREQEVGRFLAQANIGEAPVLDTHLRAMRARLMGPGPDTLKATASEVLSELYSVVDALEVIALQGRISDTERSHLSGELSRSAAVLAVVGQNQYSAALTKVVSEIQQLQASTAIAEELAGIADELATVKLGLESLANTGRSNVDPQLAAQTALLHEMEADLSAIKRSVSDLIAGELPVAELKASAALLENIAGTCDLLALSRVKELLIALADKLVGFAQQEQLPNNKSMEAVADVLIGIEYYLSEFAISDAGQKSALDMAESSLGLLG